MAQTISVPSNSGRLTIRLVVDRLPAVSGAGVRDAAA